MTQLRDCQLEHSDHKKKRMCRFPSKECVQCGWLKTIEDIIVIENKIADAEEKLNAKTKGRMYENPTDSV